MGRPPRPAIITLLPAELAILNGNWAGSGGFQTLAPKLQAKVTSAGQLSLDDEEVGEIMRYMSYVQSGFRNRIRAVFGRSFRELTQRK